MDWSPVFARLPDAVPAIVGAIVGGLLGSGAGVITQYVTHRFTRQRDHERLLREKAEELIGALDQFPDWVVANVTAQSNQVVYQASSPMDRADVVQRLYFPQLAPHLETLREALFPVFQLMLKLKRQPLSAQERAEAQLRLPRLLQPYHEAKDAAIKAILATPLWKPMGHSPRPLKST